MPLKVTTEERAALQTAQGQSRNVRHWRRYQAVLLRADGVPVATVAQTLNCTETSVYNWVAAWRADGVVGVAEGRHPGKARRLHQVSSWKPRTQSGWVRAKRISRSRAFFFARRPGRGW